MDSKMAFYHIEIYCNAFFCMEFETLLNTQMHSNTIAFKLHVSLMSHSVFIEKYFSNINFSRASQFTSLRKGNACDVKQDLGVFLYISSFVIQCEKPLQISSIPVFHWVGVKNGEIILIQSTSNRLFSLDRGFRCVKRTRIEI